MSHPDHSPGAQEDFSLSSSRMQESTHFSSFLQINKNNVIVLYQMIVGANEFHDLDMARYEVQKGPMCHVCVPVTLCLLTVKFEEKMS